MYAYFSTFHDGYDVTDLTRSGRKLHCTILQELLKGYMYNDLILTNFEHRTAIYRQQTQQNYDVIGTYDRPEPERRPATHQHTATPNSTTPSSSQTVLKPRIILKKKIRQALDCK